MEEHAQMCASGMKKPYSSSSSSTSGISNIPTMIMRGGEGKNNWMSLDLMAILNSVWTLMLVPFQIWLWMAMIPFRTLHFVLWGPEEHEYKEQLRFPSFLNPQPAKSQIEMKRETEKEREKIKKEKPKALEREKELGQGQGQGQEERKRSKEREEREREEREREERERGKAPRVPLDKLIDRATYEQLAPTTRNVLEEMISKSIFKSEELQEEPLVYGGEEKRERRQRKGREHEQVAEQRKEGKKSSEQLQREEKEREEGEWKKVQGKGKEHEAGEQRKKFAKPSEEWQEEEEGKEIEILVGEFEMEESPLQQRKQKNKGKEIVGKEKGEEEPLEISELLKKVQKLSLEADSIVKSTKDPNLIRIALQTKNLLLQIEEISKKPSR